MRHLRWTLVGLVVMVTGCGAAVGEVRMGAPHAPKAADCPLEFVSVSPSDMMPGARFGGGGRYEQIGAVNIGADEGTDPMSEEMRKLVRPRACGMGGEVVSLLASGTAQYRGKFRAQQNISFLVWGAAGSRAPQAF